MTKPLDNLIVDAPLFFLEREAYETLVNSNDGIIELTNEETSILMQLVNPTYIEKKDGYVCYLRPKSDITETIKYYRKAKEMETDHDPVMVSFKYKDMEISILKKDELFIEFHTIVLDEEDFAEYGVYFPLQDVNLAHGSLGFPTSVKIGRPGDELIYTEINIPKEDAETYKQIISAFLNVYFNCETDIESMFVLL